MLDSEVLRLLSLASEGGSDVLKKLNCFAVRRKAFCTRGFFDLLPGNLFTGDFPDRGVGELDVAELSSLCLLEDLHDFGKFLE